MAFPNNWYLTMVLKSLQLSSLYFWERMEWNINFIAHLIILLPMGWPSDLCGTLKAAMKKKIHINGWWTFCWVTILHLTPPLIPLHVSFLCRGPSKHGLTYWGRCLRRLCVRNKQSRRPWPSYLQTWIFRWSSSSTQSEGWPTLVAGNSHRMERTLVLLSSIGLWHCVERGMLIIC